MPHKEEKQGNLVLVYDCEEKFLKIQSKKSIGKGKKSILVESEKLTGVQNFR